MSEDVSTEWFHQAALAAGFVARREGWLHDAERVRRVVYHLYERGEWPTEDLTPAANGATPGGDERTPGGTDGQTQAETPARSLSS